MIKLTYMNDINEENFLNLFKKIAKAVTKEEKLLLKKKVLNVWITDNKTVHEYNLKYRNVDRPTDVISFPSDVKGELGDIMISYEKAVEQAKEYNHSIEREMGFLFLHGCLHCLGYDHIEKKDEEIMFPLQDKILNMVRLYRNE